MLSHEGGAAAAATTTQPHRGSGERVDPMAARLQLVALYHALGEETSCAASPPRWRVRRARRGGRAPRGALAAQPRRRRGQPPHFDEALQGWARRGARRSAASRWRGARIAAAARRVGASRRRWTSRWPRRVAAAAAAAGPRRRRGVAPHVEVAHGRVRRWTARAGAAGLASRGPSRAAPTRSATRQRSSPMARVHAHDINHPIPSQIRARTRSTPSLSLSP